MKYEPISKAEHEARLQQYIVDDDYSVLTAAEFLTQHARSDLAYQLLLHHAHYRTRELAERAAMEMCEQNVQQIREQLLRMKRILVTERPWEKK